MASPVTNLGEVALYEAKKRKTEGSRTILGHEICFHYVEY